MEAILKHHLLFALASAVMIIGCADPDEFLPPNGGTGPEGVLEGTVTYAGPLPCTEKGHIVGAAALLVFDVNLLPPPDGLGTSAASLATVAGDSLFAGVKDRLTFHDDGSRWCPDKSMSPVTVSGSWVDAPLVGGEYEVRGFYDLDGDFDPTFLIANEPTMGDIGGGAIDNAADVLLGKPPIYRRIALGVLQKDGTRKIPDSGAKIGGVTVTLALPLATERPVFHVTSVADPKKESTPLAVKMASDYQLALFSVSDTMATQASFITLTLGAGVAANEISDAEKSPFFLPGKGATLEYSRQDVNGDGKIDMQDHVPESDLLPSLFPLGIFSKLADGSPITAQSEPSVVIQGLTIYDNLALTAFFGTMPKVEPEVLVALRPAALCINTADPNEPGVLVITHPTDASKDKNKIISDEVGVKKALSAQFHREVGLTYGCLPEGTYSMNLVYGTGQTWSNPNEAGVCAASETENSAKTECGTRPRLASQAATLTIGPPKDAAYCKAHPAPATCTKH
jgi:hypothetical protein